MDRKTGAMDTQEIRIEQERTVLEGSQWSSEIFMPESIRRQKAAQANGGLFAHYTSASVAISILEKRQLWMRNTRVMNDFSEIQHGVKVINDILNNASNIEKFKQAVDSLDYPSLWAKAVHRYGVWANHLHSNTFIFCLSEHPPAEQNTGRLSMWRAYGRKSAKAALIFKFPFGKVLTAHQRELLVIPVLYGSHFDLLAYMDEVVNNINTNRDRLKTLPGEEIERLLAITLITTAIALKHPAFKEELEWRIVHIPQFYTGATTYAPEIEIINDVPQQVYKIYLDDDLPHQNQGIDLEDILQAIMIGPTLDTEVVASALTQAIARSFKKGLQASVVRTHIPLRE
jgi:hypothetical protein